MFIKEWRLWFKSNETSSQYEKFRKNCEWLVSTKVKNEIVFTTWLIKLNGFQMINNNIEDYVNNSFFKRLQGLSWVFEQVYTNFAKFTQRVTKQVENTEW
jgi:hypothetical protein